MIEEIQLIAEKHGLSVEKVMEVLNSVKRDMKRQYTPGSPKYLEKVREEINKRMEALVPKSVVAEESPKAAKSRKESKNESS